jgi:type IV pilus assembly protein PilE
MIVATGQHRGFTLVELMVALGIVAAVAAYAVPVYREHVWRGYRLVAVSAVLRAALYVERQLAQWPADTKDGATELPPGLAHAPSGGVPVYRLRVAPATATNGGYSIVAEPLADGPMGHDSVCGSFVLDATGRRSNVGSSTVGQTAATGNAGRHDARPRLPGEGGSPVADAATIERCWAAQ